MRMLIAALASLATAGAAHAETVGIVVTGEATLQPQLASQLERWLHDRGRTYVPGALEPEAISTLIDCFVLEDLSCARGVVENRATSRSLVYARVEQDNNPDGTRNITVTGTWFQKGHETIAERRVCTQCTDQNLFATVDELMLALVAAPPLPTGAATTPTAPTTVLPVSGTREDTTRSRLLPYSLIGVGGLAAVSGLVMIGIDEDPDPTGQQSPTYRDTATMGTVLGLAGAAAVGVGVYLWLTDKPRSQPVAAISSDGAYVGWAGSF